MLALERDLLEGLRFPIFLNGIEGSIEELWKGGFVGHLQQLWVNGEGDHGWAEAVSPIGGTRYYVPPLLRLSTMDQLDTCEPSK